MPPGGGGGDELGRTVQDHPPGIVDRDEDALPHSTPPLLPATAPVASQVTDASLPAAAAHPLEIEDLLSEILLRLPPQPSSLPRARAVSKRWRTLASDARFCARFRAHHHRNPPLLGCFLEEGPGWHGLEVDRFQFQPALEAPNHVPKDRFTFPIVPKGRFTFPVVPDDDVMILGCRHGLVLVMNERHDQLLFWDPVTGDQYRPGIPQDFSGADVFPVSGAVLCAAGDDLRHFQVVLVGHRDTRHSSEIVISVYSSRTSAWGNPVSTPIPVRDYHNLEAVIYPSKPAVIVGNSVYWLLMGYPIEILEFGLDCRSLALLPTPGGISGQLSSEICVIPAQGGGLGYFILSGFNAQLWKRKTNCGNGVAEWVLARTIALDKLLPLKSDVEREPLYIIGQAENNNMVLLQSSSSIFTVHLESLEFKKIFSNGFSFQFWPFEGVYTAGIYCNQVIYILVLLLLSYIIQVRGSTL